MDVKSMVKILKAQQDALRAAKALKGQVPHNRRSRSELLMQFSEMVKKRPSWTYDVRSTIIGEPYPPSTVAIANLKKINLGALRLETHHRGTYLMLRAIGHPMKMTSYMNAVEDEIGNVDRLALYNCDNTLESTVVLPKGMVIIIKEPYYKTSSDGACTIRVDHPSDAVILPRTDKRFPLAFQPRIIDLSEEALELKMAGNVALREKHYLKAVELYTQGLQATSGLNEVDATIERDLYRNRSLLNLLLGRYDAAKADGLTARSHKTDGKSMKEDVKALYRAARACYELRCYGQAIELLVQALELSPEDVDAKRELSRSRLRLGEEQYGTYDFEKMSKMISQQAPRLDVASFISRTAVRPTSFGRGLFTTQDIKAGDIILVEKAFHACFDSDKTTEITVMLNLMTSRVSTGTHASLMTSLVQKLFHNPSLSPRLCDLFAGSYKRSGKEGKIIDGMAFTDSFLVQAIIELNAFGCPSPGVPDTNKLEYNSTGLWTQASYANHSCLFNSYRIFYGDVMVQRATKDLPSDTEILIPYCTIDGDSEERQTRLSKAWAFRCDCALCTAERKLSTRQCKVRASVEKQIADFMAANRLGSQSKPKSALITKAETFVQEIKSGYPAEVFQDLPQLSLSPILGWLLQAYHLRSMHGKMLETAHRALTADGYNFNITGNEAQLERKNGVLLVRTVDAIMYIAHHQRQLGSDQLSGTLTSMAKELWITLHGVDNGFDARYEEQ